jgi:hypothetical protein
MKMDGTTLQENDFWKLTQLPSGWKDQSGAKLAFVNAIVQ